RLASGLIDGRLHLDAPNIATAAALALADASGSATADISLSHDNETQSAVISATTDDLVFGDVSVRRGNIEARIDDLFGVPAIDGTIEAEGASAGGVDIETLR